MSEKTYKIREIFDTLQGEGGRAGHRSIFIRFAGCNMWNGKAEDRSKGAGVCALWCDTDFMVSRSEKRTAKDIARGAAALWPEQGSADRWVVLTGGEPALQLDRALLDALHEEGFKVAIETNGSVDNPIVSLCDWVTVSPKPPMQGWDDIDLCLEGAHELKVVLAVGDWWTPERLGNLRRTGRWMRKYVQPQDVTQQDFVDVTVLRGNLKVSAELQQSMVSAHADNIRHCIDWVNHNPEWWLSLQTHKYIGLD